MGWGYRYVKGAQWERELQKRLEARGFKVIRAAGSGCAGDTPDLIVLGTTKKFAVEAKAWKDSVYIERAKVVQMMAWERATNLPVYLGWKKAREEWRFFPLAAMRETEKNFVLDPRDLAAGLTLDDLTGFSEK